MNIVIIMIVVEGVEEKGRAITSLITMKVIVIVIRRNGIGAEEMYVTSILWKWNLFLIITITIAIVIIVIVI